MYNGSICTLGHPFCSCSECLLSKRLEKVWFLNKKVYLFLFGGYRTVRKAHERGFDLWFNSFKIRLTPARTYN